MKWLYDGEFTPYGESYDIGHGTMQAINRYRMNRNAKKCGGDEEWNNGNGSLMRILPACIYCSEMVTRGEFSEQDAIETIHSVGGLAGLYYGYDSIPEDWLSAIKRREWIEDLCELVASEIGDYSI